jgi:hypothetical protein
VEVLKEGDMKKKVEENVEEEEEKPRVLPKKEKMKNLK